MNRMRSLPNILAFVRVAETLSFAEASRTLNLSPSAVSKAVARLEEELGVKLLHRTTRRVQLTIDGEDLYEGCRPLLGELEVLHAQMSRSHGAPQGRLTVSVPHGLGRNALAPILKRFVDTYPDISLELVMVDPLADIANREGDVSIHLGEMADSASLVVRKWFDSPMIVCGTKAYLDHRGRPDHPNDLAAHDCIVYRSRSSGRPSDWHFRLNGGAETRKPGGRIVVDDFNMCTQLAMADGGLLQTPAYMVGDGFYRQVLEEVLQDFRPPDIPLYIAYMDRRFVSQRIRVFVDFLVEHKSDVVVWTTR